MQRLIRILVASAAFMLLLFFIGLLLPSAWHAERSVVIRAPMPAIFPYLNSLRQWREWTVWYQKYPDSQTEYSGPEAGVGATSRWSGEDGRSVVKIMQSERYRLVVYTSLLNGGAYRADGALMLAPEGEATRVTWRAAGEVGRDPVNRYLAQWLGFRIGGEFADSLELLKQKLETKS